MNCERAETGRTWQRLVGVSPSGRAARSRRAGVVPDEFVDNALTTLVTRPPGSGPWELASPKLAADFRRRLLPFRAGGDLRSRRPGRAAVSLQLGWWTGTGCGCLPHTRRRGGREALGRQGLTTLRLMGGTVPTPSKSRRSRCFRPPRRRSPMHRRWSWRTGVRCRSGRRRWRRSGESTRRRRCR